MNTPINFYHLLTPLEKFLPKLLEKIIKQQKRVIVVFKTETEVDFFDKVLWTYSTDSFLPHGTKSYKYHEQHPIWLTTSLENTNKANILIILSEALIQKTNEFEKLLDIFNGNDNKKVDEAQKRYNGYKKLDFFVNYWQQDSTGSWLSKN